METRTPPLKDARFWAAVAAAPLVWGLGWWLWRPLPDWGWPWRRPEELVLLGLAYPVVEEMIFRGLLQGELRRWRWARSARWGISGANLVTSLVFTALHFFSHPPLAAASVMLPSLVFGHFRDRYGHIGASVTLHCFYNIGYFWIFTSSA